MPGHYASGHPVPQCAWNDTLRIRGLYNRDPWNFPGIKSSRFLLHRIRNTLE
jgi:hypothetical protein